MPYEPERTIAQFALRVVEGMTMAAKLRRPPDGLADPPSDPVRLTAPGRPVGLEISQRKLRVPPAHGMADPQQKIRLLHAFTNHELQAVELFAWALLAFPHAPTEFRLGLLQVLVEEQGHVRMYLGRLEELGAAFGDHRVNGYFWSKIHALETPAQFVCAMGLTFENANLDHSLHYAAAARAVGDERTARLLDQVHEDEIGHVRFGWQWLEQLRDRSQTASMWEAYNANVEWPLRAALARGRSFDAESRRAVGMDEDFIARLEATDRS